VQNGPVASGTISIQGRGAVWARPDRYRMSFVFSRVERLAESALEDVARRQARLVDQLTEHGVDAGAWSTSHVNLQEELEWNAQQQRMLQRGPRATATIELRHHEAAVATRRSMR
jgi:uncharacterized protein YggE